MPKDKACPHCHGEKVVNIKPEHAGYQRIPRETPDGLPIYLTPDWKTYVFPPGQEFVVIPCGMCQSKFTIQ